MAVDVALALFVLVTVSIAIVARLEPDAREPGPGTYLFALGLALPMLGRRRWPVAMLLATVVILLGYYALGFPAIGLAVPLAAALYSAAEQGRLRWALGVAIGLLVATTTLRWSQGQDMALLLAYETPLSLTLMAAVIFLGDSVRTRRDLEAELRHRAVLEAAERAREAERLLERERLRLARDLHDTIGHTMTVIGVQAGVAAEALAAGETPSAATAVDAIRTANREAMTELRATLGTLRDPETPAPRQPAARLADIERLVAQARATGLEVELAMDDLPALPTAISETAHRIVQESLTNVLRHARATQARVQLAVRDEHLLVSITDDGTAEPEPKPSGRGLAGMRERTLLLGGEFNAGPRSDGGFAVDVRLPLARTEPSP